MDYYESAEGIELNKKQILKLIKSHGVINSDDVAECFAFLGDGDVHQAQDVLAWLGY